MKTALLIGLFVAIVVMGILALCIVRIGAKSDDDDEHDFI